MPDRSRATSVTAMERQELVEGYVRGDITRRTFVRRLTVAGVTLSAALSYAELLRPEAAHALPGEDYYEDGSWPAHKEQELGPDVVTEAPVDITDTTATGRAQVDPNLLATQVWFEVTHADGGATTKSAVVTVSGDLDRRVTIPLTGLSPTASYVVRACAKNSGHPLTMQGAEFAFTTTAPRPPVEQPKPVVATVATVTPVDAPRAVTPPADVRGATFRGIRAKASLKQVLKSGVLPIEVTTDEDAQLELSATLRQPVRGVRAAATRTRKVTVATGRVSARGGRATTAKLKLKRAGRRALRGKKAATLQLEVRATDRARNRSLQRQNVRL